MRINVGEEAPFGADVAPADGAGGERPGTDVLSMLLPKGAAALEPVRRFY